MLVDRVIVLGESYLKISLTDTGFYGLRVKDFLSEDFLLTVANFSSAFSILDYFSF